ncbi:octr-1 [Pristionchus pacificus]|uniref:Octr-1 n=1 Tax=Pristionchus pacificus TaxID=54126 RepID=A0A2A6D2Q4_PRIPA|nr:octr-1 [Pristionchus pacificus]|eukprot:PDM84695.1 octr-1 [Pristionchus pacificus]
MASTTMTTSAPNTTRGEDECGRVGCLTAFEAVPTIASMLIVMLIIVLGNALVVMTVYRDSKLRSQRQNWLIVSLACADLLVGLIVMPITLAYEIADRWILGKFVCEMWLALDVLFVTASILHICAISLDRYFCVTQPLSYPNKRTPLRMMLMIGCSWLVSLLISLPPIFGLRPPDRGENECFLSDEKGYVMYSSFGSFYIPVIILVAVYAKIYSITIQHNRNRLRETERLDKTLKLGLNKGGMMPAPVEVELVEYNSDCNEYEATTTITEKKNSKGIGHVCWHIRKMSDPTPPKHLSDDAPTGPKYSMATTATDISQRTDQALANGQAAEKRRRKLKAKERQATLLLGLILFAFILSWLPFFLMYVLSAFDVKTPEFIFKFFFWLGYCNSGVNPVIYTVFNREFKRALCRQLRKMWRFFEPFFNKSTAY